MYRLAWPLIAVGAVLLSVFLLSRTKRASGLIGQAPPLAASPIVALVSVVLLIVGGWLNLAPISFLPNEKPQNRIPGGLTMITLTGVIFIQNNVAFLRPNPGQSIATPVPLMMQNLPPFGSDQDHINAAIQQFQGVAGAITVTGFIKNVGNLQFLSVQ